MAVAQTAQNPGIYLLSDHLDAALAMGEDLLTEKVALISADTTPTLTHVLRQNREIGDFLSTVRSLELAMTARLLEARKRAEELKRRESRLKPLITLFHAGTGPLQDAASALGDTSAQVFDTGDTALAFLRSRNLVARDAAGFEGLTHLAVSEDYLVAGGIRLGTLLDLIATLLDTLDQLFALYPDEGPGRTPLAPSGAVLAADPRRSG